MNTAASKLLYEMEHNRDTVLVVITAQEGSAPRKSGSFMLVGQNGHLCGTIGGGAVEKHAEEMAMECLEKKKSLVHEFFLNKNSKEDIGMVCGGEVTVLFVYISGKDEIWEQIALEITGRYKSRQDGWLILSLDGSAAAVTDRLGNIAAGNLNIFSVPKAENCSVSDQNFYMPLRTGERAILFGAGHCGKALAPILNSVDFRVVIFDNRPDLADPEEYPYADEVICGEYEKISDSLELSGDDYIVIMTSGHLFDGAVEAQVLSEERAYVGVIGSAKKIAAVNKRLMDAGISEDILKEVYTPIGLPIKAITPEEIAVSIAGEMIRVRANRRDGIKEHPPENKKVH